MVRRLEGDERRRGRAERRVVRRPRDPPRGRGRQGRRLRRARGGRAWQGAYRARLRRRARRDRRGAPRRGRRGRAGPEPRRGGRARRRPRRSRRHRPPRAGVRELRHVHRLRGARTRVPCRGGGAPEMTPEAPALPTFRGPLAGQRPRISGHLAGDPWLGLAVAALVGLSVVMVFNVSYFYGQDRFGDSLLFFRKHVLSIVLGTVVAIAASRVSSDAYRRAAYPLLVVAIVALVLVLVP